MIDRLKEDMYLCNKGIKILESLADKMGSLPPQHSADGLPRGIDISATLSELFMADLDSEIKKIDGIFFYARYVDDIIVIYNARILKFRAYQLSLFKDFNIIWFCCSKAETKCSTCTLSLQ